MGQQPWLPSSSPPSDEVGNACDSAGGVLDVDLSISSRVREVTGQGSHGSGARSTGDGWGGEGAKQTTSSGSTPRQLRSFTYTIPYNENADRNWLNATG